MDEKGNYLFVTSRAQRRINRLTSKLLQGDAVHLGRDFDEKNRYAVVLLCVVPHFRASTSALLYIAKCSKLQFFHQNTCKCHFFFVNLQRYCVRVR